MDSNTAFGAPFWGIAVTVAMLFMWLIPLFHASRSGRALPVIEVMLLLGTSILIPVAWVFGAGAAGLVGVAMALPMLGAAGLLWFAALLIALFAELGAARPQPAQQQRSTPSRYPPPRRIEEPEFR